MNKTYLKAELFQAEVGEASTALNYIFFNETQDYARFDNMGLGWG